MDAELELRVTESLAEDVGRGFARLDPEDIKALKGVLRDVIKITGEKKTVARITGRRNSLLDSNAPFATGE